MGRSQKIILTIMGKADLHVHTYHSPDALSSIKGVLKRAKGRQLDIIGITDHDTIHGAKKAKELAPEFGIEVVIGEEITAKEGGLIALFIQEKISPNRPVEETVREIHQQGGLAIVPHPDNWLPGGIPFDVIMKVFDNLDGIELLNGAWFGWRRAEESKKLNNSTFNLAPTGGSDSHLASQVGCAYTVFSGKTPADLYASIKEKKTWAEGNYWSWKDRIFWLLSTPRILYKYPQLPVITAQNIFKRIFS